MHSVYSTIGDLNMLGLVPFLIASGVEFDPMKTKVHLACFNGHEHPIDEFYAGRFPEWQNHQTKPNFKKCANVLSLIDLRQSNWLFAGVYNVVKSRPHPQIDGHFIYSMKLLENQSDMIGRIIVRHQRTRTSYVWCKPEMGFPIVEIRREKMSIADFPGYKSVIVSHKNLQTITRQKLPSWHAALSNIRGIYLILDTLTGKPYVGKASGGIGIWQRWCAYADNGHGGNVQLKEVLRAEGSDYVNNFQYSILEIADTHTSDDEIRGRESYWMNVLKSRHFGLN